MPINASHEYLSAEKKYLDAKGLEDKIYFLEEMIKVAPKHKSSENLLKELRVRLKKFRVKSEKGKKRAGGKKGIRKEGFQFVFVGKTNSGKSSLLKVLTNAKPRVAEYEFTTCYPGVGTFEYEGVHAQIIDLPSIGSEYYDVGLVNTADCLILVVEDLKDLKEVEEYTERSRGKRLIVVNKVDKLSEGELVKLKLRMKSKRIAGFVVSAKSGYGIKELRYELFLKTGMMRIYLKEPGKKKQEKPMVLKEGATLREVAEQILKGFSSRVKITKITGPSSKFPNQKFGLKHIVKDKDIVEFHTR